VDRHEPLPGAGGRWALGVLARDRGRRGAREQLAQLGVLQLEKPVTAKELRASISRIASGTPPS